MNTKQLELLDHLVHWKTTFLQSDYSFESSLGVESIEDLLDNITSCDSTGQAYKCIASELIGRLSEDELTQVRHECIRVHGFADLNFNNLTARYYL